jgi:transposase InsO family protein
VSGIDDHSRYAVSARVVARATARPTCDALLAAIGRYGAPEQILTDNGKVFTGRYGPGTGQVLFDRICADRGIEHLLTAPRSPTTTGKVEQWHKTLRREFLAGKTFTSIADSQAQLDAWVAFYNHDRPHKAWG